MTELYKEALDQAAEEYKGVYQSKMKFIRGTEERVSASNMVMMRARDLEKELNGEGDGPDTFNMVAMDMETGFWLKCPCCASEEIHQKSKDGKDYIGCLKCRLLLNQWQIKLMKKPRK